jgi:peptidoglycan/xylan/chitin deacetylase (PgdA/CDA1 family)
MVMGMLCSALAAATVHAADTVPVEPHHRLLLGSAERAHDVALTLDACGGAFDAKLIDLLIARHVPATVFVTKRWLDRNAAGLRVLREHADLFELQNHGTAHVPAVIGPQRRLYGMAGMASLAQLDTEVHGAAEAIRRVTGQAPTCYRGAGAAYDPAALHTIEAMGYRVAGFSVNADAGATLPAAAVAARLRGVKPGDVVIAHMNKPASGTAAGFAAALPELQQRGVRFVTLSRAQLVTP